MIYFLLLVPLAAAVVCGIRSPNGKLHRVLTSYVAIKLFLLFGIFARNNMVIGVCLVASVLLGVLARSTKGVSSGLPE